MARAKQRILLIYSPWTTFTKADYDILSSKYDVTKYQFKPEKGIIKVGIEFIKQFIYLALNCRKFDVFFTWFAGYQSFWPVCFAKIFNKKTLLIIGGYDAVSIPQIEFGLFYKKNLRALLGKFSYRFGDYILPVDDSLINSTNYYINPKGEPQGFMNFVRKTNGIVKTVPTGYNEHYWRRLDLPQKGDVITVGVCYDEKVFLRKGHDIFLKLAENIPELNFTLVGVAMPLLEEMQIKVPSNVNILSFVSQDTLRELFSTHKVFTQLSMSEGLPNTLCEAMLCGCIPVGSEVNGIPLAIGETGFVIKKKDVREAKEAVTRAIKRDDRLSPRARILDLFHENKRINALTNIIDELKSSKI